ncbi:MAG: hypothetical protein IE918_03530 [Campylobacterales bacterium]|nr:hypothetical protein [Campylobacterales bacterium]
MRKISFMDQLSFSDKPVITLMCETSHSKERVCSFTLSGEVGRESPQNRKWLSPQ